MSIANLEERKKRPVVFKYPNGNIVHFKLEDEFKHAIYRKEGDYYFHIQRIKNPDTGERSIRFAYYRKEHGEPEKLWRWGSRTAMMLPEDDCIKLFSKGKTKEWWKDLLDACAK